MPVLDFGRGKKRQTWIEKCALKTFRLCFHEVQTSFEISLLSFGLSLCIFFGVIGFFCFFFVFLKAVCVFLSWSDVCSFHFAVQFFFFFLYVYFLFSHELIGLSSPAQLQSGPERKPCAKSLTLMLDNKKTLWAVCTSSKQKQINKARFLFTDCACLLNVKDRYGRRDAGRQVGLDR